MKWSVFVRAPASVPSRGVWGHAPRKILDFGPSEIVSDGVLSKNVPVSYAIQNYFY